MISTAFVHKRHTYQLLKLHIKPARDKIEGAACCMQK